HESHRARDPLLRGRHADRPCHAPLRQASPVAEIRAGGEELLGRALAARPRARIHAGPVLMAFLREFVRFLAARKKYWLIPVLVMLVLIGGLLVIAHGSAIAPFIYT